MKNYDKSDVKILVESGRFDLEDATTYIQNLDKLENAKTLEELCWLNGLCKLLNYFDEIGSLSSYDLDCYELDCNTTTSLPCEGDDIINCLDIYSCDNENVIVFDGSTFPGKNWSIVPRDEV